MLANCVCLNLLSLCLQRVGPRVGLSTKYPEYLLKEYRYLKQPSKIPKYRNTIITSLHKDGKTEDEIKTLTKISATSIKRAVKEFDSGKELDDSEAKELKQNKINLIFGYNNK
jgi:hypothetical protein